MRLGLERGDCDLRSPFEAHAMQFLANMQSNFGHQSGRKREKEILVNGFRALREAYTVVEEHCLESGNPDDGRPLKDDVCN